MENELNLPVFKQAFTPPKPMTMDEYQAFIEWTMKNTPIDIDLQRALRRKTEKVVPFSIKGAK